MDSTEEKKTRTKREPKYTYEQCMEPTLMLKSVTETGNILRSIGHHFGAPRAGKETVEEVWSLVTQDRPQSEIKNVMILAANEASSSRKKTITVNEIREANNLILRMKKTNVV